MNSWQSPVDADPSVGTLHFITTTTVVNVNPADTNYAEVDLSTYIPVGSKAVSIGSFLRSSSASDDLLMSNVGSTPTYFSSRTQVANVHVRGWGITPVSPTRTIFYKVTNTNVDQVVLSLTGYYL